MSMHITPENYEEFYLDYLEGNLSGALLVAFEAFLDAHPDLRVDDESLPVIDAESIVCDPIQKLSMKQGIDLNDLNAETLSFFLIARQEGLLSDAQQAHLNHWLEANAHYQQDARLFALTTLQPDTNEVFAHKATLKKPVGGRVIPLWTAGLAVAAGLALFFTLTINNQSVVPSAPANGAAVATTEKNDSVPAHSTASDTNDRLQSTVAPSKRPKRGKTVYPTQIRHEKQEQKSTPGLQKRIIQQRNILQEGTIMASLEKREAGFKEPVKTITPLYPAVEPRLTPRSISNENSDLAILTVDEMKNPIKPVTSRLSETFNANVDFRTAKAANRKGGGFYLRLGWFGISHQQKTASL